MDALPHELLDAFACYLDAISLMHFCRAVPRLNHYASTIFDAAQKLQLPLNKTWPNIMLTIKKETIWITEDIDVKALIDLCNQFDGCMDLDDLATKKIYLKVYSANDLKLWTEKLECAKKQITTLTLDIDELDLTMDNDSERVVGSLEILKPKTLRVCGWTHRALFAYTQANVSSLQSLILGYEDGYYEHLAEPNLFAIVNTFPSLRLLHFENTRSDKHFDVLKNLPDLKIETVIVEDIFSETEVDEILDVVKQYEVPVAVGGACGGSIQNAPICDTNLDCISTSGAPGSAGICTLKVSDVGGPCQQPLQYSAVCKAGLVCVLPPYPIMPGASGTCQIEICSSRTSTTTAAASTGGYPAPITKPATSTTTWKQSASLAGTVVSFGILALPTLLL
ncbi:hypothetical protein HDU79_002377 [Rhizoclosmatium sp. JEL0117]|nr:hypothetical protein HDU79_002377 [Rhizoclosmatium sp. JEL0117]